mgnify:CR=1 FL=1
MDEQTALAKLDDFERAMKMADPPGLVQGYKLLDAARKILARRFPDEAARAEAWALKARTEAGELLLDESNIPESGGALVSKTPSAQTGGGKPSPRGILRKDMGIGKAESISNEALARSRKKNPEAHKTYIEKVEKREKPGTIAGVLAATGTRKYVKVKDESDSAILKRIGQRIEEFRKTTRNLIAKLSTPDARYTAAQTLADGLESMVGELRARTKGLK